MTHLPAFLPTVFLHLYTHMSLQNEGTILYGYSYTPEGKFIDEASLEELLIILESDTDM